MSKYDLTDPTQHQKHLYILAGSDEVAAQELIKEIEKLPSYMQINYMYPHTLKLDVIEGKVDGHRPRIPPQD